ncbi:hypothetical protein [Pseudomonas sp. CFT9]|uniref:hypothetical protein n=1 Tax=Pseudomonas sp. CFT9 TaxID=911244 RepID=UPI000357F9AC|nr:hypothetical protein [Pseudomonas sp. CFT9]EPJ82409.1 hypothetical protein CFT9_16052 [Pseudomonas sp. CFT9]OKP74665.1 hypothetical protein BTR19_00100 [Pseudomonas fluorescens]
MFFPMVMGFLVGAFSIFFLSLAILAFASDLSQMISPVVIAVLKDVGGPVAAGFGGAIAGAVCSYIFQKRTEKEKENKADISTIHKTWVRLMMQMNELYSIKKYNIFPSLGHAARFIDISKLPSNAGVIDRVDPRIIDIALSVKDARAIDILYLADARYRACFENFANRNEGLDEYRATLKSAGLGRAGGHSLDELKDAVGLGQLVAIHVMTEQTIEILDETLSTLRSAMDIITVLVNKKYKGQGVLSLKMDIKKDNEYLMTSPAPHFTIDSLKEYLTRNDKAK